MGRPFQPVCGPISDARIRASKAKKNNIKGTHLAPLRPTRAHLCGNPALPDESKRFERKAPSSIGAPIIPNNRYEGRRLRFK